MKFRLRRLESNDFQEAAVLIYKSLNAWYQKNRGFDLVSGPPESMLLYPKVYEVLDPNSCVVAEEWTSKRLAGTCFFHVRPTHIALGILNVHPDFFGQSVASLMLSEVINLAKTEQKPLRLVSSSMNLDSFSLYNRAGFRPTEMFQDMILTVPETGFDVSPSKNCIIRSARLEDVPKILALEKELSGINREKDFRFFLNNNGNIWHFSVLEQLGADDVAKDVSGNVSDKVSGNPIRGFLVSVNDPGCNMLGPGLARTESDMSALIRTELNEYRGQSPVVLIPTKALYLRQEMYELGAKNCELHIAQVLGESEPQQGIRIPTFMPETA